MNELAEKAAHKIETVTEIQDRWRKEGRKARPRDALLEWQRQHCEELRRKETEFLAYVAKLDPADQSSAAKLAREIARDIQDHRDAGHYTTQHSRRITVPEREPWV